MPRVRLGSGPAWALGSVGPRAHVYPGPVCAQLGLVWSLVGQGAGREGLMGSLMAPNELSISFLCSKFPRGAKHGLSRHEKQTANLFCWPWPMGPMALGLKIMNPWAFGCDGKCGSRSEGLPEAGLTNLFPDPQSSCEMPR